MSEKKEKLNIWSLLKELSKLINKEVTTTAGKVNLISDLALAAVVATIFAVDTFERIAIAIVSIWNPKIMEYLSSADTLTAFIILVGFFVLCLIFLFFSERVKRKAK